MDILFYSKFNHGNSNVFAEHALNFIIVYGLCQPNGTFQQLIKKAHHHKPYLHCSNNKPDLSFTLMDVSSGSSLL